MNTTMAKVATKSPLIFSLVAVAGVVGTAVCAVKSYEKHKKLLDDLLAKKMKEKEEELKEKYKDVTPDNEKLVIASMNDLLPENKKERYFEIGKVCWTAWIPTAAVIGGTIAAIVLAHKVSASQLAAVSAAAAFGGKKLSEQKYKLKKLIGTKNYEKLEAYISGKKVDETEAQDGLDAFHDQYSGETVYAKLEDIQQAFLNVEEKMSKVGRVTFDDYAKEIKLPMDIGFRAVGWSGKWIGLKAIPKTSEKGMIYYSIEYPYDPTSDFINTDDAPVEDEELIEDPHLIESNLEGSESVTA